VFVFLIAEVFSPECALFCNQEVDSKSLRDEIACNELLLDLVRAIEKQVRCAFGFYVVGEPSMQWAEIPFVEVVVEAVLDG